MKVSPKKKIIVPLNGYIAPLKRKGPIDVPYMETFANIALLLNSRIPVYEVLSNGMKVKLTLMNFDKQNDTALTFIKSKKANKVDPKATKVITDEEVNANSMETILANSTKRMPDYREMSKSTPNAPASVSITEISTEGISTNEKNKKSKPHKNYIGEVKDSQMIGTELVELK